MILTNIMLINSIKIKKIKTIFILKRKETVTHAKERRLDAAVPECWEIHLAGV